MYDWEENDIFLYFCKNKVRYCGIYDEQMLNSEPLRVSTPLHAESSRNFHKIRTRDPIFYQQLVDLFPEMLVQERYSREYIRNNANRVDLGKYSRDAKGMCAFIDDVVKDPAQNKLAREKALAAISARVTRLRAQPGSEKNLGGYPLMYIMEKILSGSYKRYIPACLKPKQEYFDYEGIDHAV
jgi:hypothetical protein